MWCKVHPPPPSRGKAHQGVRFAPHVDSIFNSRYYLTLLFQCYLYAPTCLYWSTNYFKNVHWQQNDKAYMFSAPARHLESFGAIIVHSQFLFGGNWSRIGKDTTHLNNVQRIINYWSLSLGQFTFCHKGSYGRNKFKLTVYFFPILLQLIYKDWIGLDTKAVKTQNKMCFSPHDTICQMCMGSTKMLISFILLLQIVWNHVVMYIICTMLVLNNFYRVLFKVIAPKDYMSRGMRFAPCYSMLQENTKLLSTCNQSGWPNEWERVPHVLWDQGIRRSPVRIQTSHFLILVESYQWL